MDRDQFTQGFLARLDEKIPLDILRIVSEELNIYAGFFDIDVRETALAVIDMIPECFKAFLVSKKIEGLSDTTMLNYNSQITRFFNFIRKAPENVTANDIRLWLYNCQYQEGVSGVTVNNKRVILNSFFTWAHEEGYIPENPCRKIGKIKYAKRERKPLTRFELEMVRDACDNCRDEALIEFLYSTGCRVSELIHVKIEDVDFQNGKLQVIGKGNKQRTVYLNEKALYCLQKYLNARHDSSPYLFVSKNSPHNQLAPSSVHYILEQIGTKAKLTRNLHPHLIRHTTATNAVDHGMPIEEVQKMLGHSNLNTTMIYAKITDENVKNHHRKCVL